MEPEDVMKIYFVVGKNLHSRKHVPLNLEESEEVYAEVVSGWDEIQKSMFEGPSYQQYSLFKLLEYNKHFWNEVRRLRKKAGIPEEGLTWEQIKVVRFSGVIEGDALNQVESILNKYADSYSRVYPLAEDFILRWYLHPFIADVIIDILRSNFIPVYPKPPINWDVAKLDMDSNEVLSLPVHVVDQENVTIRIIDKVSKNQLKLFIDQEWNEIESKLEGLQRLNVPTIPDRDLFIVKLRNEQKMTFNEIADEIIEQLETKDFEGRINEDSVKTAYHRAVDKIHSIAYSRNKKL